VSARPLPDRDAAASGPASAPVAEPPGGWHALDADAVARTLGSGDAGLDAQEVRRRIALHGPNRLEEPAPPSALRRFARQFDNLLLYVLMAAVLVTALLGHWVDAAVIGAVIVLNATIGFLQEGRAEQSLKAIRHLLAPGAVALRDGRRVPVDASMLVPGDRVFVASGDSVPADLRLLEAHGLRIDESALTGESVPVDKHVGPVPSASPVADRTCMAYAGTMVVQGQASGVVVATGARSELGRIGRLIGAVDPGTSPLLARMAVFERRLTAVILAAAAGLFGFGVTVRELPAVEVFMAAVGLAVAAIPEGLPAILTITLAIGVQRMARRHAIVRRLPAVEALGSVTVICSDKTGTLTRNEMTVQQVGCHGLDVNVGGAGYAPHGAFEPTDSAALAAVRRVALPAVLCNDASLHEDDGAWVLAGDPTEGALLTLAMKAGLDPAELRRRQPRLHAIPFESEHRYMATLHPGDDGPVAFVKGAPERVLEMCDREALPDGSSAPLDAAAWRARIDAQARAGRRVLAIAMRAMPPGTRTLAPPDVERGLVLVGLVGIIDPPRDEAIRAVAACRAAGIRVVMITGDHGVTASAVAAQLGLAESPVVVAGSAIDALDDAGLDAAVARTHVFARANPEHKLRLVRALKARGEVVAMTGDGVNDAPALKQADVGVAMGRKGTEAAKQAGAIVLADDNFASIAVAVEAGRTVYDNLRKTVTFLLPVNGGESLTLLVAVLLGVALPILPAQVLWVNMVSSVALALVLAFEPTEPDVMRRPPRPPTEPLLSGFLVWRIAFVSALFLAGIFGLYEWALSRGADVETARTVAVNALVCMEVFYLFSVRYLKARSFTPQGVRGTPRVLASVAVVVALQAAFTYLPAMQRLFHTRALELAFALPVLAAGVTVLLVLELEKAVLRRLRPAR